MSTEVKVICSLAIWCVASLAVFLINFKRKNRKSQFAFPFIAGAYSSILTTILMVKKNSGIDFINQLGSSEESMQNANYIYSVDALIHSDILLFNLTIVLSFVLVKLLCLLIVKIIKKKKGQEDYSEKRVYYYDKYDNVWFLKENWVNFRNLLKWLSLGITLVSAVFLSLTVYFGHKHFLWAYFAPAIPLLIVMEITNYFNGYTKEEFYHRVYGMDAFSQKINNFHKLRALYEQLFPNEILVATTSNEHSNRESGNQIIDDLKKSDNSDEQITGEFFDKHDANHFEADNLIASVHLVENKNVVFFNPFYRDLSDYIALPLMNTLLSSGKCLVVNGRNSVSDDIKNWLKKIIKDYTKMESLWRINDLTQKAKECEIGILNAANLYDLSVLQANLEFFEETKFIIFIEPSLVINTAQISLSILSQIINRAGNKVNFCVCDRQADGLVDTLSHVMKQEIVHVVAPPIPDGAYTAMAWNADGDYLRQNLFDKQTKFLGNGIELSAVAVKNQIANVTWLSESKVPVRDIKWIAAQYYPTLCKYMNIPSQQKSIHEKIQFSSSLWSSERKKENFIIAGDEFNNLFITLRAFLTRGISQTFVNVLSDNYLLRDYMRCNTRMFLSNPNLIPSLVPDYSNTQRNLIIKLILMMSIEEVEEKSIIKEFHLANIQTQNALRTLCELIEKYTEATEQILSIRSVDSEIGELDAKTYYSISKESFEEHFANTLKTAYYIVENEVDQKDFLDSKLYGHITQSLLPDQFLTYDGKYYKVQFISSNSGVILRRASDLYDKNHYYRQIRNYKVESVNRVLSEKTVADIEFTTLECDFSVETTGYLHLNGNNDLHSAQIVRFGLDTDLEQFERKYTNKQLLKIRLPETDDRVRFTLSLLLSELFKSVYPNSWQYIAVLSAVPDDIDGILNYMLYSTDIAIEEDYIYIVEDSYIDLGLLSSIEKNIFKFFEIIADYLDWHEEKMREPEHKDPVPRGINFAAAQEEERRHSLFSSMAKRIRQLFVRQNEEPKVELDEEKQTSENQTTTEEAAENIDVESKADATVYSLDQNAQEQDDTQADALETIEDNIETAEYSLEEPTTEAIPEETETHTDELEEAPEQESVVLDELNRFSEDDFIPSDADAQLSSVDGTDIFDNEGVPDDYLLEIQFQELGIIPIKKTRYQRECYLKFGFEEIDGRLKINEVKSYLRVHGWSNNNFTKARKREILPKQFIDFNAENHCDFCGIPLSGVSFDKLGDGRVRCNDCSNSTISTVEEVRELFSQVLEMMENFFAVNYKVPISLEMADAKTVAKRAGVIFKPSKQLTERVLGFARLHRGKYSLVMENGSPKLAAIDTMVHELTHIWQYINWNDAQVSATYQMPNQMCPEKSSCDKLASLIAYEGMAMWTSIQYLYQMGEVYYASQQEALAEERNDVYGIGFRLYKEKYPFVKDGATIKYTPFLEFPTIEPRDVVEQLRKRCTNEEYSC